MQNCWKNNLNSHISNIKIGKDPFLPTGLVGWSLKIASKDNLSWYFIEETFTGTKQKVIEFYELKDE